MKFLKNKKVLFVLMVLLGILAFQCSFFAETTLVTLNIPTEECQITKEIPWQYVNDARIAYRTDGYADYTTSIIQNYSRGDSYRDDQPNPVILTWNCTTDDLSYVVEVCENSDFSSDKTRKFHADKESVKIYNLKTGTTYYWRVTAKSIDGSISSTTEASTFKTADGVRWMLVDGARNVRDIGGWNGLNQEYLYRGSELNAVSGHGLALTGVGRFMAQNVLKIKTDLDFRAVGSDCGNITASPIGGNTVFLQIPISNFMALYDTSMQPVFTSLADFNNYPVYMHCWGGADRTGTVAFMVEGLCGVAEEDLAIDLEQTAFSMFGNRYRYDNGSYLYGSMIKKMKTYSGETLQKKFENCAETTIGLTKAQISNIQNIYCSDGALFDNASLGNITQGQDLKLSFIMRNSTLVNAVKINDKSVDYTFTDSTLTISKDVIEETGIVEITFDNGTVLKTYLS